MDKYILTTERLLIRHVEIADASFIFELLNEPEFHKYIGDKQIRTIDDAIHYIKTGPQQMYKDNGFALHIVVLKDTEQAIGFCGFLKRDVLPYPDLGFAFLQKYCGKGYAYEAAQAVLNYELASHNLTKVMAMTAIENPSSQALLSKLGFKFEQQRLIAGYDGESKLYVYS
ncbi:MAG: GNAT family N-acetyltransferase [Thalassotalea sp.]|nr:GNAT family N-acetyltransferase [Thalassotalea sp.]MDG2392042.1 GNAT family N-acetyltransferase [Thalassotalea sp.]